MEVAIAEWIGEWWKLLAGAGGAVCGNEALRWLFTFRSKRKQEAAAAMLAEVQAERAKLEANEIRIDTLKETLVFLQEQLREKEVRFAEQTELVRKLNTENLELVRENTMLKTEREIKLCEVRGCDKRNPKSGW